MNDYGLIYNNINYNHHFMNLCSYTLLKSKIITHYLQHFYLFAPYINIDCIWSFVGLLKLLVIFYFLLLRRVSKIILLPDGERY